MGVHPTFMMASLEAFTSFYETQGVNMQHSPTATYMQDIYRRQVSDSPLLSEETLARDGTRRAMLDLEARTQASMAILLARSDRISLYRKKLRCTRRSSEPSGLDPGSNSAWIAPNTSLFHGRRSLDRTSDPCHQTRARSVSPGGSYSWPRSKSHCSWWEIYCPEVYSTPWAS